MVCTQYYSIFTWSRLTVTPFAGHQDFNYPDVCLRAGLTAGKGNETSGFFASWQQRDSSAYMCEGVPGGLLSEECRAEDLSEGTSTKQVGRWGLANTGEVAQQALQGQPVLWRKCRGAGHQPQVMCAFVCTLHFWRDREIEECKKKKKKKGLSHPL